MKNFFIESYTDYLMHQQGGKKGMKWGYTDGKPNGNRKAGENVDTVQSKNETIIKKDLSNITVDDISSLIFALGVKYLADKYDEDKAKEAEKSISTEDKMKDIIDTLTGEKERAEKEKKKKEKEKDSQELLKFIGFMALYSIFKKDEN